jgi:methionine synthase II (cobalamin-independent)
VLVLRSQGVLLPTTIVGSLPRPAWLRGAVFRATGQSADYIDMEHRAVFEDAVRLAAADQRADGIDIVSDGNLYMETDTPYQGNPATLLNLRFPGFGFGVPAAGSASPDGPQPAVREPQPIVREKIRWTQPLFGDVLRALQRSTSGPVKININPGPAALSLWCVDEYYGDIGRLRADLADAFNAELRWLAGSGADVIQIADPSFLWAGGRDTWAAELICRATARVTAHVTWHMCYGATTGDPRRELGGARIAMLADEGLSGCCTEVHLETARNGMAEVEHLLPWAELPGKYAGIGVIDSSSSVVETVDDVAGRLRRALEVLPAHKVVVSTDCGLSHLRRDVAFRKIRALTLAVRKVRAELGYDAGGGQ